ncbi:hypothetical protein PsorP6_012943 [Peronosclerospora sorghi]|uniref:Uncharacterized protein n=1 Tax=Peronosclerospora sorghi TaxID=230839 RepID=A0ACC0WG23_9STRA|nr:hypothetical protein PsorP6_012943 [Peronosclerospora sorghi]
MDATTSSKDALDDAETQLQPIEGQVPVCCGCGKSNVKYRCPRCERITCSLHCCVEHKKQYNCDGKRDRTKFLELKDFTDADLSSDYFFLEEISRSTNSAARSRSQLNAVARLYTSNKMRKLAKGRRNTGSSCASKSANSQRVDAIPVQHVNPDIPADWIMRFPVSVQLFAHHSAKRGVALTLLAPGMSKRTRNSSYIDTKRNTMYWRVEWIFPSAQVSVNLFEERVDEKVTPFALLEKYLTPTQENVPVRGKLKKYTMQNWKKNIMLLLRKEFTSASQPQYYRLNGNESLESNLKRKAIVEFPVITVALVVDAEQYPIAHDLIEVVSLDANDQQHPAKESKPETEGQNDKNPSELVTDEGTAMSEEIPSSPEEKDGNVQTSPKPKALLVEEVQVPQLIG